MVVNLLQCEVLRDRDSHDLGTSHTTTTSPKPFFRAPWRVCCSQHRKFWMDDIKEWTSLPMPELHMMSCRRKDWKISAESSIMSPNDTISRGAELNGTELNCMIQHHLWPSSIQNQHLICFPPSEAFLCQEN